MDEKVKQRLNDLETSLGLLQHDFEAQNEMILLNTKQLNNLEKAVRRLADEIESLKSNDGPTNLEDEVPPHY